MPPEVSEVGLSEPVAPAAARGKRGCKKRREYEEIAGFHCGSSKVAKCLTPLYPRRFPDSLGELLVKPEKRIRMLERRAQDSLRTASYPGAPVYWVGGRVVKGNRL